MFLEGRGRREAGGAVGAEDIIGVGGLLRDVLGVGGSGWNARFRC